MLIAALYACIFWMTFNFTSSLMGGVYIASDLGGSTEIASYAVSFFGLGNACTFPLSRILENRIGKIKSLLIFLFVFIVTTFFLINSSTFPVFVILRFISGAASGVFFPLALGLINSLQKESSEKNTFAFLAFFVSIIPVMGACFGGWIAYDYHWQWIFLLQLPLTIVTFFILYGSRTKLKESPTPIPFDTIGYIFYLLFICSLSTAIFLGQELDWLRSPLICCLLTLSLFSSAFFILWELKQEDPFIDLKMFHNSIFSLSVFSVVLLFSCYFGMVIMLTLWLHLEADYTPMWIALLLLHMVFASILLFIFMTRYLEKTHPFLPIILAILFFAVSCFYSSCFNVDVNFLRLSIARVLAGFGLAFFLFPLFKVCLDAIAPHKKKMGSLIFQSSRLLAGSLGISLYNTLLLRRTVFYHDRLGSSLTNYSNTTQQLFTKLSLFHEKGLASKELLETALSKQSTTLALADCFYFMGWLLTGLLFFMLFFLIRKRYSSHSIAKAKEQI